MAELAVGLGSLANDALNIANKRSTPNTVDSTLQNALACRKPECAYHIDNAKLEGSLTEAQANALKKAAMGKADDAAGAANDFNRNRPSNFRKSTVNDAWDNAANGSQPNTKQCPTCGKDVKGNPYNNESRNTSDGWDVSHNPSWSNRPQNYNSRKELLDDYNSGVQLECRNCNRSGGNNDARFGKNGDN